MRTFDIAAAAVTLVVAARRPDLRFRAFVWYALRLAWLSRLLRLPSTAWAGGPGDFTLYWFLKRATALGLEFTPEACLSGEPGYLINPDGGATMIISIHSPLNLLVPRLLADRSILPVVAATDMRPRLLGSRQRPDYISGGVDLLLQARTHLQNGRCICAMVDRKVADRRTVEVMVDGQVLLISSALAQVARTAGAQLLFAHAFLNDRGQVEIRLKTVAQGMATDQLLADFGCFLRGAVLSDRRARRPWRRLRRLPPARAQEHGGQFGIDRGTG